MELPLYPGGLPPSDAFTDRYLYLPREASGAAQDRLKL